LNKAKNDKVRQQKLDILLIHAGVSSVKGFKSEKSSGDISQALGDGESQSKKVDGDEQDVSNH
jgi:hypothetical protein